MYKEFIKRYNTFKNWWRFVPPANRLRFNVVAHLRSGPKIHIKDLRSVDYATIVAIAGEDSYCFSEIKDPSVIVDVGAHIGTFSLLAAHHFPQATVYAIEPDPENYRQLLRNIELNNYGNIVPLNSAISTDYGSTFLFRSKSSVAHSVIDSMDDSEKIRVETIPLSHFSGTDVLKFDAEGAEYLVTDIPAVSYIAIEIHKIPGRDQEGLVREIRSKYRILKEETEKTEHITLVGVAKTRQG